MGMFGLTLFAGLALLYAGGYVCSKWGLKALYGCIPFCIALLVGTQFDFDFFQFLFTSLIAGCVTGLSFKFSKSSAFLIIVSTCMIAAVSAANYYFITKYRAVDLLGNEKKEWVAMVADKVTDPYEAERLLTTVQDTFAYIEKLMPAYLFARALLSSAIGLFLLRPWLLRKLNLTPVRGVEYFKLNEYFIFAFISGIAGFSFSYAKGGAVWWISLNLLIVAGALYIVQAFGVIKHFLLKKGIPTVLIPLMVLLWAFSGTYALVAAIVIAGLGALDVWADFRGLSGKTKTPTDDNI